MLLPWAPKAATRSEAERSPSLSASMIPKASLNCWMAEWEKDSKMLAFLGILCLVLVDSGSKYLNNKMIEITGQSYNYNHLRMSPLLLLQPKEWNCPVSQDQSKLRLSSLIVQERGGVLLSSLRSLIVSAVSLSQESDSSFNYL